jgi:hypothetical protein
VQLVQNACSLFASRSQSSNRVRTPNGDSVAIGEASVNGSWRVPRLSTRSITMEGT